MKKQTPSKFSDINECSSPSLSDCSLVAMCENTVGSYQCVCGEGFEGNGTVCTDLDECQVSRFCDEHASCRNGYGWYSCTCNPGYYGNGSFCAGVYSFKSMFKLDFHLKITFGFGFFI